MNKHSKIVLWVGLFLILMTIVTNWHLLSGMIFGPASKRGEKALPRYYKPKNPKQCKPGYTWNPLYGVCVPNNYPMK